MKFTHTDSHCDICIESKSIGLEEVLEDFTHFLKACGYVFDGELVIHKDDYQELKDKLNGQQR